MKYIFLLIASLFLTFALSAQTIYTLEDCLKATDTHTPLAAQSGLIEDAHQQAKAVLKAAYLPQATLNGQATWQSDVTSVPIKLPNVEIPTLDKDQYRVTLDVVQPIWDGGLTAQQIAVQNAQTALEQQRLKTDKYTLREQTISLYCAALVSVRQMAALSAANKDVTSRKQRAAEQVANGAAIPATVYAFEVRLLELGQQYDEAQARLNAALEGLILMTGLDIRSADQLMVPDLPEATKEAPINRPELTVFALQKSVLEAQKKTLSVRNLPRINAIATLGYARPGLNFLSNEFQPYAILGANFRWNLSGFYTGTASKEQDQLRIQQTRLSTLEAQFSQNVKIRQTQQWEEIKRIEKIREKTVEIVKLREKMTETASAQLDGGIITPADYLTESTLLSTAKLTLDLHEIQLIQARLQYGFIVGDIR